jgi:hypothetical protein
MKLHAITFPAIGPVRVLLQIRYAKPAIDAEILQEVMDKSRIGLPADNLPLTQAKRHLASVWAGRAVVAAEVFGVDRIESVSLRIVGTDLGRLLYRPGTQWADKRITQGDFALAASLMVPLYAARATEEVLFGRDRATLSTAPEIATAGQLARWLVVQSRINPALWSVPIPIGEYSPITQFIDRLKVGPLDEMYLHEMPRSFVPNPAIKGSEPYCFVNACCGCCSATQLHVHGCRGAACAG